MREIPEFAVRKHKTEKPHFDLVLIRNGQRRHWIIPNSIPKKYGEKRIAVEEDYHDEVDAGGKSSRAPEDRYGGGASELWDRGDCEVVESKKFKLVIKAGGEKFRGNYLLFLPGWGRWTKRRLWVIERIRGNS
ncbi:MAG: DNA polymerase ligase N-terminal domain-containing protein [Deltaproteobacteria bacterium]